MRDGLWRPAAANVPNIAHIENGTFHGFSPIQNGGIIGIEWESIEIWDRMLMESIQL